MKVDILKQVTFLEHTSQILGQHFLTGLTPWDISATIHQLEPTESFSLSGCRVQSI